jgi:hypothetical protein
VDAANGRGKGDAAAQPHSKQLLLLGRWEPWRSARPCGRPRPSVALGGLANAALLALAKVGEGQQPSRNAWWLANLWKRAAPCPVRNEKTAVRAAIRSGHERHRLNNRVKESGELCNNSGRACSHRWRGAPDCGSHSNE